MDAQTRTLVAGAHRVHLGNRAFVLIQTHNDCNDSALLSPPVLAESAILVSATCYLRAPIRTCSLRPFALMGEPPPVVTTGQEHTCSPALPSPRGTHVAARRGLGTLSRHSVQACTAPPRRRSRVRLL